jgi:pyrimidine operon attenuation protein/uracil phosphoribosyltransferase
MTVSLGQRSLQPPKIGQGGVFLVEDVFYNGNVRTMRDAIDQALGHMPFFANHDKFSVYMTAS